MKSAVFIALSVSLSACSQPSHWYAGSPLPPAQLALVEPQLDEIQLLSVNEQTVDDVLQAAFYLKPGKHSVQARLNRLVINGGSMTSRKRSPNWQKTCFIAKSGKKYRVQGKITADDWEIQILEAEKPQVLNIACKSST